MLPDPVKLIFEEVRVRCDRVTTSRDTSFGGEVDRLAAGDIVDEDCPVEGVPLPVVHESTRQCRRDLLYVSLGFGVEHLAHGRNVDLVRGHLDARDRSPARQWPCQADLFATRGRVNTTTGTRRKLPSTPPVLCTHWLRRRGNKVIVVRKVAQVDQPQRVAELFVVYHKNGTTVFDRELIHRDGALFEYAQ